MGRQVKEVWKRVSIPDFGVYYEVSNLGRVKSLDRFVTARAGAKAVRRGKILVQSLAGGAKVGKYRKVTLCSPEGVRKDFSVHRLVLEAFVGPPRENEVGLHLDDNPENNCLDNLEWGTQATNHGRDRNRNNDFTSKYNGVAKVKSGNFVAYCATKYIGTFTTEVEAAKAHDSYAIENKLSVYLNFTKPPRRTNAKAN